MSKHSNKAACIANKLVRKFSFLAMLMLGMVALSSASAYAAPCTTTPPVSCEELDPSGTTIYYDASGNPSTTPPANGGGNGGNGGAATSLVGVAKVICEIVFVLIFDIGRGIATLSIIAVGVAAMFGKATWTQAVTVAVGVGIIFGGMALATLLTLNLTTLATSQYSCIVVLASGVLR